MSQVLKAHQPAFRSQVALPELPAEPLREILQVPSRRARGRMRPPEEWKAYSVPGGGLVTIPLDGPVALEEPFTRR